MASIEKAARALADRAGLQFITAAWALLAFSSSRSQFGAVLDGPKSPSRTRRAVDAGGRRVVAAFPARGPWFCEEEERCFSSSSSPGAAHHCLGSTSLGRGALAKHDAACADEWSMGVRAHADTRGSRARAVGDHSAQIRCSLVFASVLLALAARGSVASLQSSRGSTSTAFVSVCGFRRL